MDVEIVSFPPSAAILARLIEDSRRVRSSDEDRDGWRLALGQISLQEFLARWAGQSDDTMSGIKQR
jgi:hypothetical protein